METDKKLSIKEWAIDDRPREKMQRIGSQSLSDAELIAILIGSGTRNLSAVEVGRLVLDAAGNNLNDLGKKTINELKRLPGIGEAKAITLMAALELGRRRKLNDTPDKQRITCSKDAFELLHADMSDLPHEEFWILLLNRANKVIHKQKTSQGGLSGTVTDSRIILKLALDYQASGIILCHNHPSGNTNASTADLEITKKLKEAAGLLDIQIFDHLIIAGNRYLSFADSGFL
jgi:DNA repair protein RadC